MRIGLIIADFESNYTTTFKYSARLKYGVDFNSSSIDAIASNLKDLKTKMELNQYNDVHVPFEITPEHVIHVENRFNQIIEKYREVFQVIPPNMKIYTIIQKLQDAELPSVKDLTKEVLKEVFIPEKSKNLTKKERMQQEAEALSNQRALERMRKNSAKDK